MKKIIILSIFAIVAFLGVVLGIMSVMYNNQHKELHNQYEAEQGVVETRLDNMWKIISDKFQMQQEYAEDFKETAKINIGAFTEGGDMWKWVTTQMPQIDPSIYREVMVTIESERLGVEKAQKKIIDIVREHNDLVSKVPSSWFIRDLEKLEWTVISSKDTKMIMITREDERTLENLRK